MNRLSIGSSLIVIEHSWESLKETLAAKKLLLQYAEDETSYGLFATESNVVHTLTLYKAGVSISGISETNDADRAEFEASFQAGANLPLESRAPDGRLIMRTTIASLSLKAHQRAIYLKTCDPDSLVSKKPDWTDYDDVTYGMLDADGESTLVPAEAVQTFVDFDPEYSQDLIGGGVDVDPTLIGGTSDAWWAAVIAAPHIPAEYGGSISYLSAFNLELVAGGRYRVDGRSTQYLPADPTYHSNRIRFVFHHPVGASKRFQIFLESFR